VAQDDAAAIRGAAEQDAARIRQRASDQAAAILAAAERDASQMRAAVLAMSSELGQVAAYVTDNLLSPARPMASPARPMARPTARPVRKPAAEPAARPDTRPDSKRPARPRQYTAMRVCATAYVTALVLALAAGATEVALHGFPFFVFRSAGTGATPNSGLKEDQGPGQPDARGAHARPRTAGRHPVPGRQHHPARRPPAPGRGHHG
jgi:hypothetical protein